MLSDDDLLREVAGPHGPAGLAPIASRVLAALRNEQTSVEELSLLIADGRGISERILTVANAAAVASPGAEISRADEAISRFGFEAVGNVVVTVAVIRAFADVEHPFDVLDFWQHSVTTAIGAGALAERSPAIPCHERCHGNPYFMGGLLRDIGIVSMVRGLGPRYRSVIEKAGAREAALHELERDLLGYTHMEVDAALLRSWGLSEEIAVCAGYHDAPALAPPGQRSRVGLVHLSEWITEHESLGVTIEGALGAFAESSWLEVGIGIEEIPDLIADFVRAGEEAELLVGLRSE